MQERQVQSLGQEDPLEQEMGTHSSILGWRIPYRSLAGRKKSDMAEHEHKTPTHLSDRSLACLCLPQFLYWWKVLY